MTDRPARAPMTVDEENPNGARIYDYLLGGAHNFAADRERARELLAINPGAGRIARENRAFLARVVRWALDRGVDQFLDLGSGVPTVGNVHEIAHAQHPDARVAYVDIEPVAVAHAREIVAPLPTVTVTHADLRDHHTVLASPGVAGLLDLTRPVVLLIVSALHFVPTGVLEALDGYRRHLVPGSIVALSHSSADHDDPELAERLRATAATMRGSASPMYQRDRDEILALVHGLRIVEPGLVDLVDWPDPGHEPTGQLAIVAEVP